MENFDEIPQDSPLSPVLSCSKGNRKILRAKRKKTKSCVNLDKRFSTTCKDPAVNEDTFTNSQLLEMFEPFEMYSSQNLEDSVFKKPLSQVSKSKNLDDLKGAFKTAAGGLIPLSQETIEASKALFSDILNPLNSHLERPRKYSFLSKLNKRESVLADDDPPFKGFNEDMCRTSQKIAKSFVQEVDNFEKITYLKENEGMFRGFTEIESEESRMSSEKIDLLYTKYKLETERLKAKIEKAGSSRLSTEYLGFKSAAGRPINLSKKALERIKTFDRDSLQLCNDITATACASSKLENSESPSKTSFEGFKTASGKSFHISAAALQKAKHLLHDLEDSPEHSTKSKDAAPTFAVSQSAQSDNHDLLQSFKSAAGKPIYLSENALRKSKKILQSVENCDLKPPVLKENLISTGFKSASGKSFSVCASSLKKAQELFQENDSNTVFQDLDDDLLKDSTILKEIEASTFRKESTFDNRPSDKLNTSINSSNLSNSIRKKRLGMSFSKQLQISKDNLEKAERLINDIQPLTPKKKVANLIFNSTPLREGTALKPDADLTPIKHITKHIPMEQIGLKNPPEDGIIIQESKNNDINSCCKEIKDEISKLQKKVEILTKRQEALNVQRSILSFKKQSFVQSGDGVLYTKKRRTSDRISLKNGLILNSTPNESLRVITPQNSELVHFDYTKENVSFILTQDGALVLPNLDNIVGIHEIERAFKVLKNVESNLIPEGWISNHYKWIVWKLGSYQKFAENLSGCLNVDNVIQQLKYRYDREIDKAQRSTLRKIYEKDDAPQKRMILCVSNIFNLSHSKFDLELTDGWYSIRTTVDDPLCYLVNRKKIQIGTKLVICGAELLNCEGCHPLEASDQVRLKINCNSTRRAVWYAKLGYQECFTPFPLKINSCYSDGGQIGRVRIYIARVHPVKYKEKKNNFLIVWRNQKAEEICVQEWKAKRFEETESARELVMKEYEKKQEEKRQKQMNLSISDIKSVHCPETLYDLMQQSRDPETLVESLSLDQKNELLHYQQRLSSKTQQEINDILIEKIKKLDSSKRNVTSVLQLRVVDVLDPNKMTYTLQIWKPTDSHFEMLKEGLVFDVFNTFIKTNRVLLSMNRTKFQKIENLSEDFSIYNRKLVSILMIPVLKQPIFFNEFDTVGIIIEMSINESNQHLWLSDIDKSLLLIQIFDGPKNCLLFENLRPGHVISVCNLMLTTSCLLYSKATANHSTVVSRFPQHKHLEEGLKNLKEYMPQNIKPFLEECIAKIKTCDFKCNVTADSNNSTISSADNQQGSIIYDESYEDTTFVQSRITSTDIMMSLLDIDKCSANVTK